MSRPLESLQKNNLYNKNNQEKAVPLITTMESFLQIFPRIHRSQEYRHRVTVCEELVLY